VEILEAVFLKMRSTESYVIFRNIIKHKLYPLLTKYSVRGKPEHRRPDSWLKITYFQQAAEIWPCPFLHIPDGGLMQICELVTSKTRCSPIQVVL